MKKELDWSGELRVVRDSEGELYVVGHGIRCPVESRSEGRELIKTLEFDAGAARIHKKNGGA